jgi:hypothetical protein
LISQTKFENIIFRAMSATWQTNLLWVNDVAMTTVLQLQQFMSQEQDFAEPQNLRGNSNQRRNDNSHNSAHPAQNSNNY